MIRIVTKLKRDILYLFVVGLVLSPIMIHAQSPGGIGTTDLTTWFKADGLTPGPISTWPSSVGSVSVTSSGTAQPTCFSYSTDTISSLKLNFNKGVYFDGLNDYLKNNTSNLGILGSKGTLFLCHRINGTQWGSAFVSRDAYDKNVYQIKPGRFGFTESNSNKWQIDFDYFTPPTDSTKMRINVALGSLSGNAKVIYNGNQSSTIRTTYYGADVQTYLGFGYDGDDQYSNSTITEAITYKRTLTTAEINKINSYLAIKYGVTLGVNGTSQNYLNSVGTIIWNCVTNIGYANDIAGIAKDDSSALNQRRSHSVNGSADGIYSDILTVSNGTDFNNPTAFSADKSAFIWGHNGGGLYNTGNYLNLPAENGDIIKTILSRIWKAQETGTVGTVHLRFDLSNIMGASNVVGANDLANLRLLIDDNENFTSGAYSLTPTSYNNTTHIAEFDYDFTTGSGSGNGYYFTLGSVNQYTTPLAIELINFKANKEGANVNVSWTTASETNTSSFEVLRSQDGNNWETIGKQTTKGNSTVESHYQFLDRKPYTGISYYRLKEIDIDGKTTLFDPISIEFENEEILVYPNPVQNLAIIKVPSSESNQMITIQVLNTLGQVIIEKQFLTDIGNDKYQLNLSEIQNGIYYIKNTIDSIPLKTIKIEVNK